MQSAVATVTGCARSTSRVSVLPALHLFRCNATPHSRPFASWLSRALLKEEKPADSAISHPNAPIFSNLDADDEDQPQNASPVAKPKTPKFTMRYSFDHDGSHAHVFSTPLSRFAGAERLSLDDVYSMLVEDKLNLRSIGNIRYCHHPFCLFHLLLPVSTSGWLLFAFAPSLHTKRTYSYFKPSVNGFVSIPEDGIKLSKLKDNHLELHLAKSRCA